MNATRWAVPMLMVMSMVLGGCGDDTAPPEPQTEPTPESYPTYAATMDPAEAAMTFVPADAKTLSVTDYDEVKALFGLEDVTGRSSPADQRDLWARADKEAAQVSGGLLRGVDQQFRDRFTWGAADVVWEARFTGGKQAGFVIRVADRVKPGGAIKAGIGPLKGARFDPKTHLITQHTAPADVENWASRDDLVAVAGAPATRPTSSTAAARVVRRRRPGWRR